MRGGKGGNHHAVLIVDDYFVRILVELNGCREVKRRRHELSHVCDVIVVNVGQEHRLEFCARSGLMGPAVPTSTTLISRSFR